MITQGYLARHHMGRSGMAGPALLDVAQDYALDFLASERVFDLGIVLKGGTSLRKFRAGNAGRFSTDLDFAAPDAETGELLIDMIDGAEWHQVRFRISDRSALRGRLEIETPLGSPDIPARIEVSPRPLWLPCSSATAITLPVHAGYEFAYPTVPVPALEEALAEKLAAWRRRQKMRDLYDLYWFGRGVLDEALVRRLLVLKIWHDVVDHGLGSAPFVPDAVVADLDVERLPPENIGLLTQPVEPRTWLDAIRTRYRFLTELDEIEREITRCSPGDRWRVNELVRTLASSGGSPPSC
jgi:uncharacterized protein